MCSHKKLSSEFTLRIVQGRLKGGKSIQNKNTMISYLKNKWGWGWFSMSWRTKAWTLAQSQKYIRHGNPRSIIKCGQQGFWHLLGGCFIVLKSSQKLLVLYQDWNRLEKKIPQFSTWYPRIIEVGNNESNLIDKTSIL